MAPDVLTLVQQHSELTPSESTEWLNASLKALNELDHWFCAGGSDEDTPALAHLVLSVLDSDTSQLTSVTKRATQQCSECLACVISYHTVQENLKDEGFPNAADYMEVLAAERLHNTLVRRTRSVSAAPKGKAGDVLDTKAVCALLEVLAFHRLLTDRDVMEATASFLMAVRTAKCDVDVTDSGCLPGMFRLTAHPDEQVRAFVLQEMIYKCPMYESAESLDDCTGMRSLLDDWVDDLAHARFGDSSQGLRGREAFENDQALLWAAFSFLLRHMLPEAVASVLQQRPELRSLLVQHATSMLHPDASTDVLAWALPCLKLCLEGAGAHFWQAMGAPPSACEYDAKTVASMLLDGVLKLHHRAEQITNLLCTCLSALLSSLAAAGEVSPSGREVMSLTLDGLLACVPQALNARLPSSTPDAKAALQRCAIVTRRSAWQALKKLAVSGVRITSFAAVWFVPLRALFRGNGAGVDLAAELLVHVLWLDLLVCWHLATGHLPTPGLRPLHADFSAEASTALIKQAAVSPKVWSLLPVAVRHTAAASAILRLCCAAAAAPVFNRGVSILLDAAAVTERASDNVPVASPSVAAAVLWEVPQAVARTLNALAQHYPGTAHSVCLGGAGAPDALRDVLALTTCGRPDVQDAAERVLAAAATGEPVDARSLEAVQDRMTSGLVAAMQGERGDAIADALIESVTGQVTRVAGEQVDAIFSDAARAGLSVLRAVARLVAMTHGTPLNDRKQLASLTDTAWRMVIALLMQVMHDAAPAEASSSRSAARLAPPAYLRRDGYGLEVLKAALRLLAMLWETGRGAATSRHSQNGEAAGRQLAFLEPFFALPVVFCTLDEQLLEIWQLAFYTIVERLPRPLSCSPAVRRRATDALAAHVRISDDIKASLTELLGRHAPGNLLKFHSANPLSNLPSSARDAPTDAARNNNSATTGRAAASDVVDLTLDASPPRSSNRKASAALHSSPIGKLWNKARQASASGDAANKLEDLPLAERVPARYNKPGTLDFCVKERASRTKEKERKQGATLPSNGELPWFSKHAKPDLLGKASVPGKRGADTQQGAAAASQQDYKRPRLRGEQRPRLTQPSCDQKAAASGAASSRPEPAKQSARPPPPPPPPPSVLQPIVAQRDEASKPDLEAYMASKKAEMARRDAPLTTVKLAPMSPLTAGVKRRGGRALAADAQPGARAPGALIDHAPALDLRQASSEETFIRGMLNLGPDKLLKPIVSRGVTTAFRFNSIKQYSSLFESLLLEEMRAGIASSTREGTLDTFTCTVSDVQRGEGYWQATATLPQDNAVWPRVEDLLVVRMVGEDDTEWFSDQHRLALVIQIQNDSNTARPTFTFNIKVTSMSGGNLVAHRLQSAMRKGARLSARILLNVIPHMREVRALVTMHTLPRRFLHDVLQPRASSAAASSDDAAPFDALTYNIPADLRKYFEVAYNHTQQQAIASALRAPNEYRSSITLIQGPPGTGKTSAIMGILSGLLHNNTFQRGSETETPTAASGQALKPTSIPTRRVLVCAQSNAAVDELLCRLSCRGLPSGAGRTRAVAMLRLGNIDSAHPSVLRYHVDYVVDAAVRVGSGGGVASDADTPSAALRKSLLEVAEQLLEWHSKDDCEGKTATISRLQAERGLLEAQLAQASSTGNGSVSRARPDERRSVLKGAELVLCTLSAAGGDLATLLSAKGQPHGAAPLSRTFMFDAVIVDEAAQAIEPATLIPMLHLHPRQGRVILVGDPKQLPPTVLSQAKASACLAQSMFERLQRAGHASVMLQHQYRMHPAISAFPAAFFYGCVLKDGVQANDKHAAHHKKAVFGPLVLLDVEEGREARGEQGSSLCNHEEAKLTVSMLNYLFQVFKAQEVGTVVVITPYKAQARFIRQRLPRDLKLYPKVQAQVEVATVDAFQGKEADIVIFTCVRAQRSASAEGGRRGGRSSIGFLEDVRRMNVGLTRARRSLWVLAHVHTLCGSAPWRAFAEHAEAQGVLYRAVPRYSSLLTAAQPERGTCAKSGGA